MTSRRVLIVVPSLHGGGAEFVARSWGGWLALNGFAVDFATTLRSDPDLSPHGCRVIQLAGPGPLRHIWQIRSLTRRNKYYAVIGMLPYYSFLACLSAGREVLRFVSARNVETPDRTVHTRHSLLFWLFSRALFRRADGMIAISHPVAAEVSALFAVPNSKLFVVPNPAMGKVGSAQPSSAQSNPDLQTPGEELEIVVPGRIVRQKRPLLAVEVASLLRDSGREAVLTFCGQGDMQEEVQAACDRASVPVKFVGWDEYWFRHVSVNSVALLPSSAEGFGNVLVEAAASGIPSVVCSRALGSADAIVPEVTGVFSLTDTPDSLATAVIDASLLRPIEPGQWLTRFSVENSGRLLVQALTSAEMQRSLRRHGD